MVIIFRYDTFVSCSKAKINRFLIGLVLLNGY
nr:MAG TPA: hypothetical protein [Caudoviricetes sp.]